MKSRIGIWLGASNSYQKKCTVDTTTTQRRVAEQLAHNDADAIRKQRLLLIRGFSCDRRGVGDQFALGVRCDFASGHFELDLSDGLKG